MIVVWDRFHSWSTANATDSSASAGWEPSDWRNVTARVSTSRRKKLENGHVNQENM